MELVERLSVGPEEFFKALSKSAAYDVSQAVGKTVSPSQLYSGYTYKKKFKNKLGQAGETTVVLKKFEPPKAYEAWFKTSQGRNFISYEIEDLKDGSIKVHYQEGFEGKGMSYSLNYKLMSWLVQRGAKKRVRQTLKSMETFIIKSGEK